MSKEKTHQNPGKVWGGQSPYLQDLYGRAQTMLGGDQFAAQLPGMLSNMMTPAGFQDYAHQMLAPAMQGIGQSGVAGMNLGGSRQGVAQAQAGNNMYSQWLQNLPGLYNLGMQSSGWGPLAQYAGLLGAPTVLQGGAQGFNVGLS